MRRIWSVLLPLALAACSENPVGRQADVVLEVQASAIDMEDAVVEAVQGGVAVRGVYVAPTSGYTLRAFVRESAGGDVVVTVGGYPPDAAFHVVSGLEYRATIPLAPGTRTVSVRHFGGGDPPGSPRDVTRQQVTVSRR
ncbi:MAG TPA: hypothetical protein VF006_19755 [Longimicrobium sp.]